MSNSSRRSSGVSSAVRAASWSWFRWVDPADEETWISRLDELHLASWTFVQRPGQVKTLLTVYSPARKTAEELVRRFQGRIQRVAIKQWLRQPPAPPLMIGRKLEIVHVKPSRQRGKIPLRLYIPQGLAFGSGEHATTSLLLAALVREPDVSQLSLLDLGTGSGILALTG